MKQLMLKFSLVCSLLISLLFPAFGFLPELHPVSKSFRDPMIFADFFSPNGDGHNDTFEIKNIEEYPINKIHIFNRWGDKVFEAEPYMNDWNGTVNIKNQFLGDAVPDGTYFYRFEYLVGDFPMRINGKIILKR